MSLQADRRRENDPFGNGVAHDTGGACSHPTVVELATEGVIVNRQIAGHVVMGLELLTSRWGGVEDRRKRSRRGDHGHHREAGQPL